MNARVFFLGLVLVACVEDKKVDQGEEVARSVKTRIDRERADAERRIPGSGRPPTPPVPAPPPAQPPDLGTLSTPSACPADRAIPLLPAIVAGVCFGQTPKQAAEAWNKEAFLLAGPPGRQTTTVAVTALGSALPAPPFVQVTLAFENEALEAVELVPNPSRGVGTEIVRVLDLALGPGLKLIARGGPFGSESSSDVWYQAKAVHAYVQTRGPKPTAIASQPIQIWRAQPARDGLAAERYKAAQAREQARRDEEARNANEY